MKPCLVLAVLTASLAFATAREEKPKEGDALKGSWLVTGGTEHGRPFPEEEVKKRIILTFAAGKMSITEGGKTDPEQLDYKTDPKQTPMTIDITEPAGRGPVRGIYKIEGDKLTICLAEPGKDRPTMFEVKSGSDYKLVHLKRTKP